MMRRIAEFPLHDAHDFAVMDGRIELLEIQDMRRDGIRIDMALPPWVDEPLIHQAQHAFHGKAAGFRPDDGRLDPRLTTAFSNGFGKEHNRPNHFVIVLNVVDKAQLVLRKILHSRHAIPPLRDCTRHTTAGAPMGAGLPLARRRTAQPAAVRAWWQNSEAKQCGGNYYILQK